jgi:MoaA/NifB/PqqE/SkfB family radical SAM enzyme
MIRRAKGLELMIFFYNPFEHIWFKSVLTLKIMDFENVPFNKSCSYLCDEGHESIIYMI